MANFDNKGSLVSIVSGTQIAAGGTLNTTPLDLSPFEGNAVIMFHVNPAGTGTLAIVAQEGTASVSTWTPIGTHQMFQDGSVATPAVFSNVVAGSPAIQVRVLALEKTNQFLRFNITGTDSSYRLSVTAFLRKKYANWDALG